MKRLIRPATWTAAIAVALVLLGAAAARRRSPGASATPPPPEVSVVTVVPETVAARYEYVGQAEASRRVEVRALVTGVIVARPYVEGTDVAAGTLLFRVDPTTYDAAYRRDRKSTRLNSSHGSISYAVLCLKKEYHKYVGVEQLVL